MKKLLRPFQEAMHQRYEKMTFYKTPRGKSRKMRKYEHVDLSKEFEIRVKQREARKMGRLEELYEEHDRKALSLKDIVNLEEFKNVDRAEMTPEQITAIEQQEDAQKQLLAQLKKERKDLVAEFDEETDLKQKVIVEGIK